jgi:hypothetical protein
MKLSDADQGKHIWNASQTPAVEWKAISVLFQLPRAPALDSERKGSKERWLLAFQVGAVPAAIQAMPVQKLQIALTKSIANLKARDRAIETMKKQLAATRACEANESVHSPGAQAKQAEQLRQRAQKAEDEVAELVKVSKASAAAHEVQVQELSMELTVLRRRVTEHEDSKVCYDAASASLHPSHCHP